MSVIEEFYLMNIDQRLISAIADLKWKSPTDIQQSVIPLALEKKSMSVQARTGSGKTGAFCIPIIHSILGAKIFQTEQKTSALLIAPTKELCNQITKDIKALCKYASKNINCLDVAQSPDADLLRPLLAEKPDIVIGTPFRVLAQLHRKRLDLDHLTHLVVDEADLIFTFGYEKDVQELKTFLPKKPIQVILMSATLDETTKALRRSLRSGEWVRVELPEENFLPSESQLTQYMISAEESAKYAILISMIRLKLIRGKTIIFTNSIDRCYKLKLFLEEFGVKSVILNSELPVATRCHTVQQFNKGLYEYLLATDEQEKKIVPFNTKKTGFVKPIKDAEYGVSRGIDFKFVSNVLNFDFPMTAHCYVHRVGRTARADQMGTALSFVNSSEESRLAEVANLLNQKDQMQTSAGDISDVQSIFRPFQFRMSEVDGFRYRAADIVGRITRKRIREARLKEIKMELINSERLKGYFDDHAADLDALRHDKPLTITPQTHLKDVPEYMVPKSLQTLMRGVNQRARDRQRYKLSNKPRGGGPTTAGPSSVGADGTVKLSQLRSHKTKMALVRNPAKLAQIKKQMARKKKANNPLFSFGKSKENRKK